jgi:hypothetical protein
MFDGQPDHHPNGCRGADDAEYGSSRFHSFAAAHSTAYRLLGQCRLRTVTVN